MQITEKVRKCVAYVRYRHDGAVKVAGTAWFVGVPKSDESQFQVTVTAQHVLNHIRMCSDDGIAVVCTNTQENGLIRGVTTHVDDWLLHDDPAVDVAVLPGAPDLSSGDHLLYPIDQFTIDFTADGIGLGDEVFIVGLFSHHAGISRDDPIVRIGNIAAMPVDKVQTKMGRMEVILIEARSTGGLSGSPVFVNLGSSRQIEGGYAFGPPPPPKLCGLVHGHFDEEIASGAVVEDTGRSVNVGIALVVPARHIKQVVDKVVATLP
jgi:hypothetical protein